jgi:predicted ATPase
VSSKSLLLVLDNCEHLVASCAAQAEARLRACGKLHILTTSREPLGVEGETIWQVPPLTLPKSAATRRPDDILRYEALALLVDRARPALPGFTVTGRAAAAMVDICQRLDGLPLALELGCGSRPATPS